MSFLSFYLSVFLSFFLFFFCPFVTSLLLFRIWDRYNKPVNKDMCGVLVGNFHVYLFFYLVSVLVAVSLIFCISVLFVIFSSFSVFLFYSSSEFEIGTINWSTKICACVLVGIRYSKVILSLCVLLYLFLSLYICLSLVLYFCLICHSSSLSSLSVFLFYCSSGFEISTINWSTKICARVLVGIRYSKVILSLHVLLYLFLSLYICLSLVLYFCLICHSSSLSSLSVFLFYCSSGFEIGTINWSTKICACVLVRILSSKEIFMSISSSVFLSLCLSISSFLYCCHSLVMFYCCS